MRLMLLIFLMLLGTACATERVKLCEEENPEYNSTAECQNVIAEKYPDRKCTFSFGPTEWLPMGSCRDCIIRCE